MDEEDSSEGVIRSPIKRLGSTRKVLAYNNIRVQLGEQLRCLDVRMESQVALVAELQDFFRRRAEVELDYSKNLDKLAKSLQLRHKEQKQKREQWPLFSSYSCWQQLVSRTKTLSKDHAALSEVYSTHLVSRLGQVAEDVQRIYRRCREIGYETHEEILRVLHELHTTMKTYHSYQGECRQAETKLRLAENQRLKLEQSLPKEKLDRSKKFRLIEKEVQKRKSKHSDARLKALKARNEYTLCLEASNTTIHKYFVDDLSDLIDCMDFGFHNCVSRALLMHVSAEEGRQRSAQCGIDAMNNSINSLDSRLDKQRFLEFNHSAFMIPKKFEFQGQRDEGCELEAQKSLRGDLELRLTQLRSRVTSLRTESEEVWKTLETAEVTLLDMLNAKDYDCAAYFGDSAVAPAAKPPETVAIKLRADRQETEEFYMAKFREYLLGTSRIARLDTKHEHIRLSLIAPSSDSPTSLKGLKNRTGQIKKPPRRKRIGRLQMNGQTKLFGGSLEEYLESTNEEIPLIIKSCVRVINLYGLHHQGIFRVSGSQLEINNFRESFERGEDPLADVTDASDINSVAGVLKLYLRELREPLFPIIYFEHFMELAQLESKQDFVIKLKDLIQSLPRSFVVVLRYLFAFLNHLSEYSDESMMDPYNLAICFGPTLVPVPEDKDQVQYQNQVNELIKNIILFNEDIFPLDGGPLYEKYISKEPDENDVGDSPSEHLPDDIDSEVYPSEDESETMEATVQFDFLARSERELSLKKGDNVTLFTQVSNDWWRGSSNGQEGLIPDKYILLKIKDEDRDKMELLKSSSSEESVRRRASSSNDSVLSSGGSSTHHSPLGGSAPAWPVPAAPLAVPLAAAAHETGSSSPRLKKSSQSIDSAPADFSSHRASMGVVETALSTAQLLATAALQAEAAGRDADRDSLSDFLDSLPGDDSKRSGTPTSTSSGDEAERTPWKPLVVSEPPVEDLSFSQNRELWKLRASQSQLEAERKERKASRSNRDLLDRQKHTPDLVMDLPVLTSTSPKDGAESSLSSSSSSSGEDESSASEGAASPTGPESPDMTTAAERFAKQNQCTLKKNTKTAAAVSNAQTQTKKGIVKQRSKYEVAGDGGAVEPPEEIVLSVVDAPAAAASPGTQRTPKFAGKFAHGASATKPQVKVKPAILRKPTLPLSLPLQASPEPVRKEPVESAE